MSTHTPHFDKKIISLLEAEIPGTRVCRQSGRDYVVRREDIEFYKKLHVPVPLFSPSARFQRIFADIASDELFKRTSDFSGKEIITNIDPESPSCVYDDSEWWTDTWQATDYGQGYNQQRTFFDQWFALKLRVPRQAKSQYSKTINVNSDWAIEGYQLKDCYFVHGGVNNENLLYSVSCLNSRHSMEIYFCLNCELCYSLYECDTCYHSSYLEYCANCNECVFGFDLKNCTDCFGCYNLRNKKYCYFNQQLSEHEYKEKRGSMNLGSRHEVASWQEKFSTQLKAKAVRKNLDNLSSERCFGNNLKHSAECYYCFRLTDSQRNLYSFMSTAIRDCCDVYGSLNAEQSVQANGKDLYNVKFSHVLFNSSNSEYCENCYNIEYCFGCVSLRNKKYCILNTQYTEEDYWRTVDQIKCRMLDNNEYGQLIPYRYALFPYNLTPAFKIYPLDTEAAAKLGGRWYKLPKSNSPTEHPDVVDDSAQADASILTTPLVCPESDRPHRIVAEELAFYKKHAIPIPVLHPLVRRFHQLKKLRQLQLITINCAHCTKEILAQESDADRIDIAIVCEECYKKALGY